MLLIGKKIGMTQIFSEDNRLVPVTVVQAGPCPVIQVKTKEKDRYDAIQLGFRPQKPQRVSQALKGHFKKAKVEPHAELCEFRAEAIDCKPGDTFTVKLFKVGEKVDVRGTTKGKGFQGVVKRWNFSGGPASHGSMTHRRGGSYGQCQWPGEIDKGRKMPGHAGARKRTTQGLEVIQVIEEQNIVLLKGSIHGPNNGLIYIRHSIKGPTPPAPQTPEAPEAPQKSDDSQKSDANPEPSPKKSNKPSSGSKPSES